MKMKTLTNLTLLAGFFALSGCASFGLDKELKEQVEQEQRVHDQKMHSAFAEITKERTEEIVSRSDLPYVSPESVAVQAPLPSVFRERFTLNGELAVNQFSGQITSMTGLRVYVSDDVYDIVDRKHTNRNVLDDSTGKSIGIGETTTFSGRKPGDISPLLGMALAEQANSAKESNRPLDRIVTFDMRSPTSLKDILDMAVSQLHVDWEYDQDARVIRIQRRFTEQFVVDSFVEHKNMLPDNFSGATKSSSKRAELDPDEDIWESMRNTVEAMLSSDGTYSVNENAGVIVVNDNKQVLSDVGKYLTSQNNELKKDVLLDIEILEFNYNDENNRGLDFSLLTFDGLFQYEAALGPAGLAGGVLVPRNPTNKTGSFAGSSAMINALNKVGKITDRFRLPITASNNQISPVVDGRTQGYLASASETTSATVGATSNLELGYLTTGHALNILPKISRDGNSVRLIMGLNISRNNGFKDVSDGIRKLQAPDINEQMLTIRDTVKNGQTLVVGALEKTNNTKNNSGLFDDMNWWLGGEEKVAYNKTMMVILVTPYISNNSRAN